MSLKCPFLSSIGRKYVNCIAAPGYRWLGKVEFESAADCNKHADALCFDRFLDCEKYREYYADPDTFTPDTRHCVFCCNSTGCTGLPEGYDGSEWCFCQKWQKPMKKTATCAWNNRHLDWPFEESSNIGKETNMIQYISIDKLCPHPDNPRKDLGDLTELIESIKAQGVLQNLTVVSQKAGYCISCTTWNGVIGKCSEDHDKEWSWPCSKWASNGKYTVVIGHRRLAAAKMAGLIELPCAVVEMDDQTQISTMLLENMQRSDLTVYEQAQGFQMLLDFGASISDIAEKTGFSQTTVRRRVKLLELDQEKLKESAVRGGTLMDYIELEKIEDIELRNSVLEKIGTPDFNWALKQAISQEASAKNMALLIELLDTFAKRIDKPGDNMRYATMIIARDYKNFEKPSDADTAPYYYIVTGYSHVSLYTEYSTSPEAQAAVARRDQLREQAKAIQNALKEETQRAYNLRWEYVSEFSNAKAKKYKNVIIEYLMRTMVDAYMRLENEDLSRFLGIELPEDYSFDDLAEKVAKEPERCLLAITYLSLDSERAGYFNWNNDHVEDEQLDTCYEFLEKLGYQMSEKERQLRDGTHELFQKEEGEQ